MSENYNVTFAGTLAHHKVETMKMAIVISFRYNDKYRQGTFEKFENGVLTLKVDPLKEGKPFKSFRLGRSQTSIECKMETSKFVDALATMVKPKRYLNCQLCEVDLSDRVQLKGLCRQCAHDQYA